jgi:hypothetical protein
MPKDRKEKTMKPSDYLKTSEDYLSEIATTLKIIMVCVAICTALYAFNFFTDISQANAVSSISDVSDVNIVKVGGRYIGAEVPVSK